MQTMADDRFDRNEGASGDGSWRALIAATGCAVRGIATAFNPFIAVGMFFVALAAGGLWLSGMDTIPVWLRFVAVVCGSGLLAYVAGKVGNALLALLAVVVVLAALGAVGYGVWALLA